MAQQNITVLAHRVHEIVSTGSQGGNIVAEWEEANNARVEWITAAIHPLHERFFREASLSETQVDVAFVLNRQAVPSITSLLQPLDGYQQSRPIEAFDDIFPGMVQGMTFGGQLYGIPFRHSTSGLHYNAAYAEARGLEGPPEYIEEWVEYAKKMTFTKEDGTKVYGYIQQGGQFPNIVDLARAWDGDFITMDYQCAANEAPMVRAVGILRELFEYGAIPKAFTTISSEDVNAWIQTGRGAMTIGGMGRNSIYNDPETSQYPGDVRTVNIPISRELSDQYDVAPAKVEFWTMVIPKNSTDKELAWSFVRHLASKESTLAAALNGNGPVRASTYEVPEFNSTKPYAAAEKALLEVARVPLPPFDDAARAGDIFEEEAQAAILGMKLPQAAMDSVCRRVAPLLPQQ